MKVIVTYRNIMKNEFNCRIVLHRVVLQVFYEKDYKTSRVCSEDGEDGTCSDKYPLQMDLGNILNRIPRCFHWLFSLVMRH